MIWGRVNENTVINMGVFAYEGEDMATIWSANPDLESAQYGMFAYKLSDEHEGGPSTTPEPTTIVLLGAGLIGLAVCGRKYRK